MRNDLDLSLVRVVVPSNTLATHSQHISNTLATHSQHIGNTSATHVVLPATLVDDNDAQHDTRVEFLRIIIVYRHGTRLFRTRPCIQEGAEARADAARVCQTATSLIHVGLFCSLIGLF